jgi:small-conductance mechanosensitive channel
MKNSDLIKVYKLLNVIKGAKSSIQIKVKVLKNLQLIDNDMKIIKELEAGLEPAQMQEYGAKHNALLAEKATLREDGINYDLTPEVAAELNEIRAEYADMFAEQEKNIAEHNAFLQQETNVFTFIKFTLDEVSDVHIEDELTDAIEFLVEI